jgi:hypothetical protein
MAVEIWRGPSKLDETAGIVLLASKDSNNQKTGDMIQTWILHQHVSPGDAARNGADKAVCGSCRHSGGSCYVQIDWAPRSVWAAWQRGNAPPAPKHYFDYQLVRCGAYGDPAAVPYEVWEPIIKASRGYTGYTHQWATCDPRFAEFCMASVDDPEEKQEAQALGYRTFRVGARWESRVKGEALCPASDEAGNKLTCAECLACGGKGRHGSVYIPVHGSVSRVQFFHRELRAQPQTQTA